MATMGAKSPSEALRENGTMDICLKVSKHHSARAALCWRQQGASRSCLRARCAREKEDSEAKQSLFAKLWQQYPRGHYKSTSPNLMSNKNSSVARVCYEQYAMRITQRGLWGGSYVVGHLSMLSDVQSHVLIHLRYTDRCEAAL